MRWTHALAALGLFAAGFGARSIVRSSDDPPPTNDSGAESSPEAEACRAELDRVYDRLEPFRTSPAEFPTDPAAQPAAVLAELAAFARSCPWVTVVQVDCSEFPCLVVQDGLCPEQLAAGWSWTLPEDASALGPEVPDVYRLARYPTVRTVRLRVPAGEAQREARDRLAERIAGTASVRAPRIRDEVVPGERRAELRWLLQSTVESGRFAEHPQVEAQLRAWSNALRPRGRTR